MKRKQYSSRMRLKLISVIFASATNMCYSLQITSPPYRKMASYSALNSHRLNMKSIRKNIFLKAMNEEKEKEEEEKTPMSSSQPKLKMDVQNKVMELTSRVNEIVETFLKKLYEILPKSVQNFLPNLKLASIAFFSGCIITLCVIFIPVYQEVSKYQKPVALFETILSDLDRGYVEEVNTIKLFETGVSAMLRSLDPYTEYYNDAIENQENVLGKYAGVGIVISGNSREQMEAISSADETIDDNDDDDEIVKSKDKKYLYQGIKVVNAFEGYAFDYGVRVGDRLLSIDNVSIESSSVEEVRNILRGEPNSVVNIKFTRDGVKDVQEISLPRRIVKIPDVKCYSILDSNPMIGYIQLSGFSQQAGNEVRSALLNLQERALLNDRQGLQGVVLDLRGNPGGLLTSAVDVASIFVPKNSDIVSARGRGFPGVLYRSRIDPLLNTDEVKLIVLTNGQTASAAEIVSGAIQDLDVGVILGADKTFGKGLVQNVEELPYNSAIKYTVARYYTPSGRCIQALDYKEGGGLKSSQSSYTTTKIKDKTIFYTKAGREVKNGGGIEADYKVASPRSSALEVTLLRKGVFADFASEWSKKYTLTDKFKVTEDIYQDFIQFVNQKQKSGDLELEAIYRPNMDSLQKVLKESGFKNSQDELRKLKTVILKEIRTDFIRNKKDIVEDIQQNILARYLPESMLIEGTLKSDIQVDAAIALIKNQKKYDQLLARSFPKRAELASLSGNINTATTKYKMMNFHW